MAQIQESMKIAIESLRAGQLDEAKRACDQILEQWPSHALSWHILGVIEHQNARYKRAIEFMQRAIELDEAREGWHFALGVSYRMAGRPVDAIASYRRAIKLNPRHADAHNNLGSLLLEEGDHGKALVCFKRAIEVSKGHAGARANLGICLAESGQPESGIEHLRIASRLKPKVAAYQCALGRVLRGQYQLGEARACYRHAIRLDPQCAEAHHGLGTVRQEQGEPADALAHFRSALRIEASAQSYRSVGTVLARMGQYEQAAVCFERALQRQPNDPETIAAQARLDEIFGRFDEGWQRLRPLIDAGVDDVSVIMVFAAISRHIGRQDDAIAMLRKWLEAPIREPCQQMPVHFGLGKLLDEQRDYDAAFDQFRKANALKPRSFDMSKHQRFIDSMIGAFSEDVIAKLPRASRLDDRPIFIVGMPRSGTSLIEQMLSSHAQIYGAGELQQILRMAQRLPKSLGSQEAYPACVVGLTDRIADSLAKAYLDHLTKLAPDTARMTDKLPGNFLHLGLISRLLPQARVIHCRRDPMDTCLSCYFQNFTADHSYAYNLEHLGFYYRQYERLMSHWARVLDMSMMTVYYEQLINDTEPTLRSMLTFCGLPWDDACLRFHESNRHVTTASYDQVRRPLYTSSMNRWRNYERHLEPLRKALEAGGGKCQVPSVKGGSETLAASSSLDT